MTMLPAVLMIPAAFLCGSIPTGLLIGRAKGIDIRQHGSKNIGATNVGRVLGRRWFYICLAIDFIKACAPTLLTGYLLHTLGTFDVSLSQASIWLLAMAGAVMGNIFNPWLNFKGGKGVAASIGAMMGVFPALAVPGAMIFLVFITTLAISRFISLSSVLAAVSLTPFTLLTFIVVHRLGWIASIEPAWPFVGVTAVISSVVIARHRANLLRIRAGTEPRVGERVRVQ
jgi:glycerol-3-phosphate acyltransferase PlsY